MAAIRNPENADRICALIARDEAALKRFESGWRIKQENDDGSMVDITDDEIASLRDAVRVNKAVLEFLRDGRDQT